MGKTSRIEPPRMGGIALKNGVVLVSERHWAAAVRNAGGDISVASGRRPRLPGSGGGGGGDGGDFRDRRDRQRTGPGGREKAEDVAGGAGQSGERQSGERQRGEGQSGEGLPLLRGLGRFGESLLVLVQVKAKLPQAELPLEGGRVAGALVGAVAATSVVKAMAPKSALVQETGLALAAFVPAVLALKNSAISGYHGAEHKVIGGREAALRAGRPSVSPVSRRRAAAGGAERAGTTAPIGAAEPAGTTAPAGPDPIGAAASPEGAHPTGPTRSTAPAPKEHDRCGSNLVGPYLLATVATNLLARGGSERRSPAASALSGAVSLGVALEALRWATKHGDSILARLLLLPGRTIQKRFTTTEPTPQQLEVGERALAELLRLEEASA